MEIFNIEHFTSDGRLTHELANIPQKVFLKYALTCNAEFRAKCIQARLCGVGLPTTIEDCERGVINQGDLVTVQIYSGDAIISDDFGVSRFPVLVLLNCEAHLLFDLTHESRCCVDSYKMTQKIEGCNQ